jgi:hypothetical protein
METLKVKKRFGDHTEGKGKYVPPKHDAIRRHNIADYKIRASSIVINNTKLYRIYMHSLKARIVESKRSVVSR